MKENEIIIKVFKILLDNQSLFKTGLCRWILDAHLLELISNYEFSITFHFIENQISILESDEQGFCWAKGFLMHRINFIDEQIKILENGKG
jgi:hypothetical protein